MGVVASKKHLNIATVNFSGILLSPFEFFSEDNWEEEERLSICFKEILIEKAGKEKLVEGKFQWGLGKIDKDMQKQRYSPIYNPNAGLENGKLIDEGTFKEFWLKHFKENSPMLK